MAAKTPDSIKTHNLGDLKLTIATFVTNDIDDNDTWASGIKSVVGYWAQQISDGPTDLNISSVSDGTFTFDSAGNVTGKVYVLSYDY